MAGDGHVVVCGLNELGLGVAAELRRLEEDVVIVAHSDEPELRLRAERLGAQVVVGSARREEVLRSAGVPSASALVAIEDDDVGNLHAALVARDLNPRVRLRLRMFHEELAERTQQLLDDCVCRDAAALAAPAFVSAVLHEDWHQRVVVAGRELVVRGGAADEPGVLLPLARIRDDGTAEVFPTEGEELLCLAEAAPAAGTTRTRHGVAPRPSRHRRLGLARALWAATDRRIRATLFVLLALLASSIAVWIAFAGLDLVDALYFTVTILTTTGFGDINLRDRPEGLELYGTALMLLGTATLTIFFALLADAIVKVRLAQATGSLPPDVGDGHVVVCGVGNIGFRIVEELVRLGVPVAAVDVDADNRFLPAVRALGAPAVVGDARLRETLNELRAADARCLVVVTSEDVINLETALNAHAVEPGLRVVLRLSDADFAARVQRTFGIHISRSPVALAAPVFAASAEDEHVIATVAVGLPALVLAELEVEPGSALDVARVADVEREHACRVLVLDHDGAPQWRPSGDARLAGGHRVTVVVARDGFPALLAGTEASVSTAGARLPREPGGQIAPPLS